MADLLEHQDPTIRERVCMILTTISGLADGRMAIVQNPTLLSNLVNLLNDPEGPVRIKAAATMEMISRFWVAADYLVDFGLIPIILNCLEKDEDAIKIIHLETMAQIMYCHGKECALEYGAFEIFVRFESQILFD